MEIRHKEGVRQNNKRYTIRQANKAYLMNNQSESNPSKLRAISSARDVTRQNNPHRQERYIRQAAAKKQFIIQRSSSITLRKSSHQPNSRLDDMDENQQEDTLSAGRNVFNEADEEAIQRLHYQGKKLIRQMGSKRFEYQSKQPLRQRPTTAAPVKVESEKVHSLLPNRQQTDSLLANTVISNKMTSFYGQRDLLSATDSSPTTSSWQIIQTTGAAERFKRTRSAYSLQQKTQTRQKVQARQLHRKRNESLHQMDETNDRTSANTHNTANQRMVISKRQADSRRSKDGFRCQEMRLGEMNFPKAVGQQQELPHRSLGEKHLAFLKTERMKRTMITQMLKRKYTSSIARGNEPLSLTKPAFHPEKRLIRLAKAVGHSLQQFIMSLASLGVMALLVIAFFAAFAALLFSPFGIFFSGQDADNHSISMAVAEINQNFNEHLDEIEVTAGADRVVYHRLPTGNGDEGRFITNWTDIVAVFAVRTAGGNDAGSMDVLTIDATRIDLLQDIFNDMNVVDYHAETIRHSSEDSNNNGVTDDSNSGSNGTDRTERILHITITSKSYTDMPDFYHFTPTQTQALNELMKAEYAQMLSELVGTYGGSGSSITITDETLQKLLNNLPENLSLQRRAVVSTAFSLVGKVHYFWGGKSQAIGWDSRWGTPTKVTAAGSRTTGTTRPFGLDCSGFVDWVFINTIGTNVGQGGGAASQYANSTAIDWQDALPGDLVFYPDLGHVGIICGKDNNGNLLVVHCASSQNNVVVTGLNGFGKIRRPTVFSD